VNVGVERFVPRGRGPEHRLGKRISGLERGGHAVQDSARSARALSPGGLLATVVDHVRGEDRRLLDAALLRVLCHGQHSVPLVFVKNVVALVALEH
jgi:hypothetical protein